MTRDPLPEPEPPSHWAHTWLLDGEDPTKGDLPAEAAAQAAPNAARQVLGLTLQKAGDLVVDAKTVLTWLLAAVGAPAFFVGLLVPIRESGSMLPQMALVPWVRSRAIRKWLWVGASVGQAAAVFALAAIALTLQGAAAGWGILLALAAFALARSVASLASKDVLGRTLPKGTRGRISGAATVISGLLAITVGLGLRTLGHTEDAAPLAILLGCAAFAWIGAAVAYASVVELPGEADDGARVRALTDAVLLLRDDAPFRRFVLARTLLLVSALSPPFVVALAAEQGGVGLAGLGPFVLSTGLASLLGGRFWGRMADRSSRLTMVAGAALASLVILALLAALQLDGAAGLWWLYPLAYLLLALAHTGVRLGRQTYIVDLASGNRRTDYVAVSNTAMGVLLLVAGALSSAVATFGPQAALLLLALLGLLGVGVSRTLPEVSAPPSPP